MLTIAAFRAAFPEFASAAAYPDAMLQPNLAVAEKLVNVERWGDLADHGIGLVTAHMVTLSKKAEREAMFGKTPGGTSGVVTSKSVDGVSVSYEVNVATLEGGGHWNLTNYGVRYLQFGRLFGAGPLQVQSEPGPNVSAGAWTGPPLVPW